MQLKKSDVVPAAAPADLNAAGAIPLGVAYMKKKEDLKPKKKFEAKESKAFKFEKLEKFDHIEVNWAKRHHEPDPTSIKKSVQVVQTLSGLSRRSQSVSNLLNNVSHSQAIQVAGSNPAQTPASNNGPPKEGIILN